MLQMSTGVVNVTARENRCAAKKIRQRTCQRACEGACELAREKTRLPPGGNLRGPNKDLIHTNFLQKYLEVSCRSGFLPTDFTW